MALTVIAAYDVSEDPRRARLAALLQVHGDRVQKSVFMLSVDSEELAEVMKRAADLIDLDRDSFYVFRQCANCWEALGRVGQAQAPEEVLCWVVS